MSEVSPVLQAEKLSKWYGNILGISEISLKIMPGIHGLLGPNGAGKSTFLKIASGQLRPNIGSLSIYGQKVFNNHRLFKRVGFCPESDCYYKDMTGWEFMLFSARLYGFSGEKLTEKSQMALENVGLMTDRDKLISAYSLGMRQRLKFASAILHRPEFLILDEPLRGIDPLWRVNLIKLIKGFAGEGKTIIVSSHVLHEIEALTNNIIMIHQGKIFAHGDIQEIRNLIDTHPHKISIKCPNPRLIAESMLSDSYVLNIQFNDRDNKIIFHTDNRDRFFDSLMKVIIKNKLAIEEITSPDDNLQSVFDYLIEK